MRYPQIHFDDAFVGRDIVDRAFGQDRAFVQAGHLDAELAHEGHVVLDDDDRLFLVDLLQEFGGLMRLHVGHAGDRLVDEQELRVLRQQHADLEPLLLAVRQRAGKDVAQVGQADGREDAVDLLGLGSGLLPEQRRAHAAVGLQRQQQVVLDGVALEHGRLLELAADAELGDLRLVEPGEIGRAVEDRPRRCRRGSCR